MAGWQEWIYFQSPVWAQQAAVATYGWRWYHRRFNPHFRRLVDEFKEREHWTGDQFRNYQQERLSVLFKSAMGSPYYRAAFDKANVSPHSDPFDVLRKLPFLSKETLRTQGEALLTGVPPRGTVVFKSSGTTGTPTSIYYTPDFHALEVAIPEARDLGWAGVTSRSRRVMFGVRKVCRFDQSEPPFWRFSPAENMAYCSIYHLSPRFLPHYMEFLRSYKPDIVMGYPSALHTLARYAVEYHDLPRPAKAVFTMSETLSLQAREALEMAWLCPVHDRYGAVEGCVFASQCEHGRYHVSPDVGVLEILDEAGEPQLPGRIGDIVCTGLQNALQPLIRYRIGDIGRWAVDQNCPCGRQMPILEGIEGRWEDVCYTPDGRQMLRFDTVFKGVENIQEAQVVQEEQDLFVVHVVPGQNFGVADIGRIRANMQTHAGDVKVHVITTPAIQRTASGKFRAVVCRLSESEKARLRRGTATAVARD